MTPIEKSADESSAMVNARGDVPIASWVAWARQAAAAPPGFGPAELLRRTTARGLTFSTRPQLVQVSRMAGRPRPHIGR